VPFGSSLSGGLDSSSIVLLIDKIKDENTIQKTFSARFKDFSKDEGEHILKVINACNKIESHNIWPNGEEMVEDLDNLFFHQEEPFGTGSVYAQWKVMELAKNNNVIVLLDGQGADEILSGYLTYYSTYLNQLFYNTPEKYKTELNAYNNYHSEVKKIEDFHDSETFQMKIGRVKRKLLSQEMPVLPNELRKRLIFDTQSNGLKTLLRYADRNSMAHSREVRLPFLSHHLVEFIFSLPDEFKLNNGWTKFILRKAMDTALPKEICWRVDKIGYEAPQVNWLKYKNIQDKINSGKHKLNDYLNTKSNLENDWQLLMIEQLL
jgi:asparagine synthase (glutamine-hydrolysing)